ncbi:zinc-binding dehydrogenase [Pendulispora brunnea]|uniref:Zinc-binding dehydrogenase n=1 Tax=Pendulispora brunnea TaxID=2905690 RepID=A0ABZ2K6C5_9BACT
MKAAVATRVGAPEVLEVREVPRPAAREGWTLVQVKAFGLNRSELMTRLGHSPSVQFPRVLGIECVGVVADTRDPDIAVGTTVAAVMGEMGRAFDGGYAEYALLPTSLLIPLRTKLDWPLLAALPETFLTAHGSLEALDIREGRKHLLIRGGTSSLGLAALAIAKRRFGLTVAATTRNPNKLAALREAGADHALLDRDDVAQRTFEVFPEGADYVLELVGANTAVESLRLVRRGGVVCATGHLSGIWTIPNFQPVGMIPSGVKLTAFHSDDIRGAAGAAILQDIVSDVEAGRYRPHLDRVFSLDQIVEAHRYMEENRATGKIVGVPNQ